MDNLKLYGGSQPDIDSLIQTVTDDIGIHCNRYIHSNR